MFASIFHRQPPRPTAHERRVLSLALLESGPAPPNRLSDLFRWAAEPGNSGTLDLVLDGMVAVESTDSAELMFRLRTEKAPSWLVGGDEGMELE